MVKKFFYKAFSLKWFMGLILIPGRYPGLCC